MLKKKVKKLNKLFFNLKKDVSIKSILEHLNIPKKTFFKYNGNRNNILDFKINKFSSISNSSDDSLIFINKATNDLKNTIGVCLINLSLQNINLIIPSLIHQEIQN